MKGYTLALDFKINEKTLNLMDELDNITINTMVVLFSKR